MNAEKSVRLNDLRREKNRYENKTIADRLRSRTRRQTKGGTFSVRKLFSFLLRRRRPDNQKGRVSLHKQANKN